MSCNLHLKCRIPLFGRAVKDLPVMKELYAHSANSQGQRHRLDDHLKGTAERAADMAKEFGCSRWGWLAGLWHDVGVCRKKPCIFPPQKR